MIPEMEQLIGLLTYPVKQLLIEQENGENPYNLLDFNSIPSIYCVGGKDEPNS